MSDKHLRGDRTQILDMRFRSLESSADLLRQQGQIGCYVPEGYLARDARLVYLLGDAVARPAFRHSLAYVVRRVEVEGVVLHSPAGLRE